jgi:DNA-binding response OmpR family regulator
LIVDDDPKIRKLLSVNLVKRNFAVQEASNGDQAIACMEQTVPDLAILDLVMPGISSNDVCVWMREQGLAIPIIVLSAYDEEELKVRALDAERTTTSPNRLRRRSFWRGYEPSYAGQEQPTYLPQRRKSPLAV